MRHTLKAYVDFYKDLDVIQLVIAEHTITIYTDLKGSEFIYRNFRNEKFTFIEFDKDNKVLILSSEI